MELSIKLQDLRLGIPHQASIVRSVALCTHTPACAVRLWISYECSRPVVGAHMPFDGICGSVCTGPVR